MEALVEQVEGLVGVGYVAVSAGVPGQERRGGGGLRRGQGWTGRLLESRSLGSSWLGAADG